MAHILAWISLVLVSSSLIFLNKWVKQGIQAYMTIGLIIVLISLVVILAGL